jgi:hypothetical protein
MRNKIQPSNTQSDAHSNANPGAAPEREDLAMTCRCWRVTGEQ